MEATISLRDYLKKNEKKVFEIPSYQRGYVWGKRRGDNKEDSVTFLMKDIARRFSGGEDIFIQGITVSEKTDKIIIIDGQQRTTFFYLLLKVLGYRGRFALNYAVRAQSDQALKELNGDTDYDDIEEEDSQDVYFFKKSITLIRQVLRQEGILEKETLLAYVLDHIRFLYINIPEEQANRVFSMMNGNRAKMLEEELIKSEVLRLASKRDSSGDMPQSEEFTIEWECAMLRSRYAREWDKWLHWWNRREVKALFKTEAPMGLLLTAAGLHETKSYDVSFDFFKNRFLNDGPLSAKKLFDNLRRIQKRFEDAFNTPRLHNFVGALARILKDDFINFIRYYFTDGNTDDIERFYSLSFLGMTFKEIAEKDMDKFAEKRDSMRASLSDSYIYTSSDGLKEIAFRLLLRLNIDEDNKQNDGAGRFFDFRIWDNGVRSLEHVFPKSKVFHKNDENRWVRGDNENITVDSKPEMDDVIFREDITDGSEHCIGNLTLLYRDENSRFSNHTFEEKKELFFNPSVAEYFKSRHLLHTIYIFANKEWNAESIAENKKKILSDFDSYYKRYDK